MLVALIDDATNNAYGRFFEGKTTESYAEVMKRYLKKYGKSMALYVDKDSVFRVNRPGIKTKGETQFGRMMKELDIRLICAHSPEAKGRIERLFGILQDRLVKEMRLLKISNMEEANEYLEKTYWKEHNKRWTCEPANSENPHREMPSDKCMERIFTLRDERRVSKSLDFSYQGKVYQIQSKTPNRLSGKSIMIFEKFDGTFWVEYEGKKLDIGVLKDAPKATPVEDCKTINSFLNRQKPLTAIQRHRKRGKYTRCASFPNGKPHMKYS